MPTTLTDNRWVLAAAAVLVQFALGAVYAWSVFVEPLQAEFGWSRSQATLPFTVTIGVLFLGTLLGGRIQDRTGPRPVALVGVVVYGAGVALAALTTSPDRLWLLVATYGVIGGFGLGLAYIVPIAMLAKWFPDRRGLATGIAVGGFGAGALVTAPAAERLLVQAGISTTFLVLGAAYLLAGGLGAALFKDPPGEDTDDAAAGPDEGRADHGLGQALRTPQWYLLTAILFLNVTVGIAVISQASPMAQEITGADAAAAAALVGILAIFNGAGRVVWASLSDRLGRMRVFLVMFVLQAGAFVLMANSTGIVAFGALAALVYLCYGGSFGTMPATAADFFGTRNAGSIYGAMIVAWSAGGVVGPLVTAALREATGSFILPLYLLGALALVSTVLPALTRPPRAPEAEQTTSDDHERLLAARRT